MMIAKIMFCGLWRADSPLSCGAPQGKKDDEKDKDKDKDKKDEKDDEKSKVNRTKKDLT